MWMLFACVEPPPPVVGVQEQVPEPITWHTERDVVARFSADVPASKLERSTKSRTLGAAETTWYETSGRSYGALRAEASVGWMPRPEHIEDPMKALSEMAGAAGTVPVGSLWGVPAKKWESTDAVANWTRAIAVTEDRLYYVRFLDNEDERAVDAHARFFDSFQLLTEDVLSPSEREATAAYLTELNKPAPAPVSPEEHARAGARLQTLASAKADFMSCMVPGNVDGSLVLSLSVNKGKVSSVRIYGRRHGGSNRPMPRRERKDMLAACVEANVRSWTFPSDLTASGVDVPLSFF